MGKKKVVYSQKIVDIEGFARILWALGAYFYNKENLNDFDKKIINKIINGIKNGTNAKSKYYWAKTTDFDQTYVEMTAIAAFLLWNPKILEKFTSKEKTNLKNWLLQINNHKFSKNNWQFFRVIINISLKKNNLKYSKKSNSKILCEHW